MFRKMLPLVTLAVMTAASTHYAMAGDQGGTQGVAHGAMLECG